MKLVEDERESFVFMNISVTKLQKKKYIFFIEDFNNKYSRKELTLFDLHYFPQLLMSTLNI